MLDFSIKCLDRKIALRDSMECSPKIFERSYKRKSQKLFHQEAKRRSLPVKTAFDDSLPLVVNEEKITFRSAPLLGSSLPNPLRMQEEERDVEDESSWQSASSVLFDSFSANESMVLSPIAHEMSNINGKELKDVSNFFQCDISSFE